jgi:hypothetical protein
VRPTGSALPKKRRASVSVTTSESGSRSALTASPRTNGSSSTSKKAGSVISMLA